MGDVFKEVELIRETRYFDGISDLMIETFEKIGLRAPFFFKFLFLEVESVQIFVEANHSCMLHVQMEKEQFDDVECSSIQELSKNLDVLGVIRNLDVRVSATNLNEDLFKSKVIVRKLCVTFKKFTLPNLNHVFGSMERSKLDAITIDYENANNSAKACFDLPEIKKAKKFQISRSMMKDSQLLKLEAVFLKIGPSMLITERGINRYLKKFLDEIESRDLFVEFERECMNEEVICDGIPIVWNTITGNSHTIVLASCNLNLFLRLEFSIPDLVGWRKMIGTKE